MARLIKWQQAALWIALNDEPTGSDLQEIQQYISVALVADVFGRPVISVAMAVLQFRLDEGLVSDNS